jgi:hypothetical protein
LALPHAALGGHLDECSVADMRHLLQQLSQSARPKCRMPATRWIRRAAAKSCPRAACLVFTLRTSWRPALQNQKLLHGLLFRTGAETLLKSLAIGSILAPTSVSSACSTPGIGWNIIPMSIALWRPVDSLDHTAGSSPQRFFLPRTVLARVFRGQVRGELKQAFAQGQLRFLAARTAHSPRAFLLPCVPVPPGWFVYCKPPSEAPPPSPTIWVPIPIRVALSTIASGR